MPKTMNERSTAIANASKEVVKAEQKRDRLTQQLEGATNDLLAKRKVLHSLTEDHVVQG